MIATKETPGQARAIAETRGPASFQEHGFSPNESEASHNVLPGSLRRSLTDICFDILNSLWVDGDSRPTQLMYKTNLSWNVLMNLLNHLDGRGLISSKKLGARRMISLTPIGKTCLQRLAEARACLLVAPDDERETFPFVGKKAF